MAHGRPNFIETKPGSMDIDPLAANGNLRKYQNPNPLHRWLLKRFVGRVQAVVAPLAGTRILDAGCGEGFMLQ